MIKEYIFDINKENILKANDEANIIRKKYNLELYNVLKKDLYYCEINCLNNEIVYHFFNNGNRKIIKLNENGTIKEIYETYNNIIYNNVFKNDLDLFFNQKKYSNKIFNNKMLYYYYFCSINSEGKITDIYYREKYKTNMHFVKDQNFINIPTKSWIRFDLLNKKIIFYEISTCCNNNFIREMVYYYKYENLLKPYKFLIAIN